MLLNLTYSFLHILIILPNEIILSFFITQVSTCFYLYTNIVISIYQYININSNSNYLLNQKKGLNF
jgi:hypothetical protein